MSIARQLLDELRKDEELRKEFVAEIAAELLSDRRIRVAVLKALRRDIATRQDIERLQEHIDERIASLRNEFREEMKEVREEIRELRSRIWWLVAIFFSMWITIILTILFKI